MRVLTLPVLCGALLMAAACGPLTLSRPSTPTPILDGATLYDQKCALCHGENGEGYVVERATALNNEDFLAAASQEFLFESIALGRPGTKMSSWGQKYGGSLSEEQVWALVDFIRGWQEGPSINVSDVQLQGSPQRGAEIYIAECAECHGMEGERKSAPILLGSEGLLRTASDGFLRHTIAKGRRGTEMPAYEDELSLQQMDDLVTYMRSWDENGP